MARTEAQKRADREGHAKTYDDIQLKVRKDAKVNRDFIKAYATARGESVNAFVLRAIKETMERDSKCR